MIYPNVFMHRHSINSFFKLLLKCSMPIKLEGPTRISPIETNDFSYEGWGLFMQPSLLSRKHNDLHLFKEVYFIGNLVK
jgi:hypothetical protein